MGAAMKCRIVADSAPQLAVGDRSGRRNHEKENRKFQVFARWRLSICRRVLHVWLFCTGLRGLWHLAEAVGRLEYLVSARRRLRVRRAIGLAAPWLNPTEVEESVRSWFRRSRCDRWFLLVGDRVSPAVLGKCTTIEGEHILRAALSQGRGVIALMSHHGAHDLLPLLLAGAQFRCAAVRVRDDSVARRYMLRRLRAVAPSLATFQSSLTTNSPRRILRWLAEGYIVGCAVDVIPPGLERLRAISLQDANGQPRQFLTGPVRLAQHGDVPLIQAFLISGKFYHFRLQVFEIPQPAEIEGIAHLYHDRIVEFERKHIDHLSRY